MRATNACKKFRGVVGKKSRNVEIFSLWVNFFQGGAEKSAPLAVCFVDNVEKLSTITVENYISQRYISGEMWKTIYRADISYIAAIYDVDNVEKLSTENVENYISARYIFVTDDTIIYRCDISIRYIIYRADI